MTQKPEIGFGFDFSFDPSLEPTSDPALDPLTAGFDPMGGSIFDEDAEDPGPFLPNTEGVTEFLPPDADRIPVMTQAVDQQADAYAALPAEERTRQLFAQMRPYRTILLAMLSAAQKPVSTPEVIAAAEAMAADKFSVYTAPNLCAMMETAGALTRVDADGEPYGTQSLQPAIVVEEGVEFYVPAEPPAMYWQISDAGQIMVDESESSARLAELLEKEAAFKAIHKRVLELAAAEEGVLTPTLSAAVDGNPLIATPRRFFVQHFIDGLERTGALAWRKNAWHTTEAGLAALEALADVVDDYQPEIPEGVLRSSAETDGVRW